MSATVAGLTAARDRLRASAVALDWMKAVGLLPATAEAVGLGLDREDGGTLALVYPQRGEDGIATVGRLLINITESATVVNPGGRGAPSATWSSPPYDGAEVVVARDPLAMWLLQQAIGFDGMSPALVVAATHRSGLPPRWSDEDYWTRFEQVTVMVDDLRDPDPLRAAMAAMAAMPGVDVAAALPPAPHHDWLSVLVNCSPAAGGEVRALIEDAPFLSDLAAQYSDMPIGRVEAATRTINDLDDRGRLRRVLVVEERVGTLGGRGGARRGLLVVRSDRALLGIVPVAAPQGTRPAERLVALSDGDRLAIVPGPGASCRWGLSAVENWMAGREAVPSDADMLSELTGVLSQGGLDPATSQVAASFVMFSYLYQCAPRLPTMIAVGGHTARSGFARIMAGLCMNGRLVGRARSRQLARLADETGATMVFDEPGPLVAPGGATEFGRFVLSSSAPDLSTEYHVGEGGLRTLRTFGPRVVCCARTPTIDWDDVVLVALPDSYAVPPAAVMPAITDSLHAWSMDAVSRLGPLLRQSEGCTALEIIAPGVARMPAVHCAPEPPPPILGNPAGSAPVATPNRLLEIALEGTRLRAGGVVSIVQLTLEAALAGGEGDQYSPERIGKWLVASGALIAGVPVVRRRLFGHITRLYMLADGAPAGREDDDGFGFCTTVRCDSCRYREPCARLFPALNESRSRQR